ncbi:unnamed protein product, partial [marine sediment metagenome]
MKFQHDGETLSIWKKPYTEGGQMCLLILDSPGIPYCKLTVNIPDVELEEG